MDYGTGGAGPAAHDGPPRVVVIGAGFAGLTAVRTLDGSGADVTLVDRNLYSTFQPLLYEVATAGLSPSDVAYPLRSFATTQPDPVPPSATWPGSTPQPGGSSCPTAPRWTTTT